MTILVPDTVKKMLQILVPDTIKKMLSHRTVVPDTRWTEIFTLYRLFL